jgi:phosphonopyruvate decarboxylase
MIHAEEFVDLARRHGFDWYAGVPCSFLTPFINRVISDASLTYISSANEGDAIAAAAGAVIGGCGGVAMMQNSGLGNAVSPLTSLAYVFRIPLLIVCTHRGAPGVNDEPQHELMGQITGQLFDTMAIPWAFFPDESSAIEPALEQARDYFRRERRPYAFVMRKDTVAPFPLDERPPAARLRAGAVSGTTFADFVAAPRPRRSDALRAVIDATPVHGSVIIATTGYTGRELYAAADRDNHFYMVGSMGCASSLGLGLAMARPDLHVVVIDGDGASLMRMGNMATLGAYSPPNLSHILLDNEAHDSTGAQATVASSVDFAGVALACGYAQAYRSVDVADLTRFLSATARDGTRFLHMKIQTGTIANLPRPATPPAAVLERLRKCIQLR